MIGISQADAKIYITKFFERYPKVEIYFQKIIDECEKNGYVQTLFGRKRYIAGINDKNMIIKKAAQREAMNMPIQGTSADIIKLAMIQIDDWMTKNNFQSKMLMQVHDELVFNVVSEEKEIFLQEIPKIMEHIIPAPIKLKVDAGIGKNWKEAK
jgi:DNA polymerase-1